VSVLFLHIPKTAGQSVHQYLIDRFGEDQVCPARDNEGFQKLSIDELKNYQVYSGHVDWNLFDQLDSVDFTFSILRDPMDRLLSYYFYLREQAEIFESRNDLDGRHGLKAALYQSPHEFFVSEKNELRLFLDQSFDNFYTYYFAGRHYSARNALSAVTGPGKVIKDVNAVVDLALLNIETSIDSIYWISNWQQGIERDLTSRGLGTSSQDSESDYRINLGGTKNVSRLDLLKSIGADDAVINRINEMCELDYQLLDRIKFQGEDSGSNKFGAKSLRAA